MTGATNETPQDYAKRRVEELRTVPIEIFGQSVRFLNTDDSERFAAHIFAHCLRAGTIDADAAAKAAQSGDPLFQHALGLLGLAERPRRLQTSRKRETNFFRDIALIMLVQETGERFSIAPTGSANGGATSACGIVAAELGLSYDAVSKVWRRLGKQI